MEMKIKVLHRNGKELVPGGIQVDNGVRLAPQNGDHLIQSQLRFPLPRKVTEQCQVIALHYSTR